MGDGRIPVPELPVDMDWFNVQEPVRLGSQRGRVVLLNFWTASSIACQHMIHDLDWLQRKYTDRLLVIGIHAPKFAHERAIDQVQKAVNRLHIHHPVANDPDLHIWRQYRASVWPSTVMIDPEGGVVGMLRGTGHRQTLDNLIGSHLEFAERRGLIPEQPLARECEPERSAVVLFPGRILATPGRLYISDSGHNRILETDHHGRVLRAFGSHSPGLVDAAGIFAAFSNPQGLCLDGDFLYVADAGNHAIRRIDLIAGEVTTIAGNGMHGVMNQAWYEDPRQVSLNTPWSLLMLGGRLLVTMAGQHQLWLMDLSSNRLQLLAGSGEPGLRDGVQGGAVMAQPTGLAADAGFVYITDSDSSALRRLDRSTGRIDTLIGRGIFENGDTDGILDRVQWQYPLDVCTGEAAGILYVADTYNNKIKRIDLDAKTVSSLYLAHELDEPGGVYVHGGRLWIANTNAHEILCVDLASGICQAVALNDEDAFDL